MVFGIGRARAWVRGSCAPSPALRSVQAGWFPTAFIRALAETGGDGPWSFAGCDPDARASPPRPVDVGGRTRASTFDQGLRRVLDGMTESDTQQPMPSVNANAEEQFRSLKI